MDEIHEQLFMNDIDNLTDSSEEEPDHVKDRKAKTKAEYTIDQRKLRYKIKM